MKKWAIIVIVLAIFLTGAATGVLGSLWAFNLHPGLVCGAYCQTAITSDRKFYADEIFVSGQTGQDQPFLLRLDLNRKKVGNTYQHYYYADIAYGPIHKQLYTSFLNNSPRPQPAEFLKAFTSQMAQDLSAKESYSFNFVLGDLNLQAEMNNLNGDFLVKNTLEYTKYVSEGDAQITLNGQIYTMHSAVAKIYSGDYSRYVFFDGYNTLKSLAQFYALWDSEGNFYLLDTSSVNEELPNYKSHTWVLYKDHKTGFMKKAFSANVEAKATADIVQSLKISVPDLSMDLNLKPQGFFTSQKDSGLASGEVISAEGSKILSGYFYYHRYGN